MKYIAIGPALVGALFILAGCRPSPPARVSESEFLLGTVVTITVHGHADANAAIAAAFDRTRQIQAKMSANEADYDETELIRVNRNAGIQPVEVSEDTFHVVTEAIRFAEMTDGAFDPTVLPLFRLWGMDSPSPAVPDEQEIDEVLELIGYESVQIDRERRTVYLPEPGMALDLGGIAKGYAVNESARVMREMGVNHAILDYGGDIVTIGTRPDGSPWRIGIQHPAGRRGQFLGVLASVNESVVSSGDYERFFIENGVRYHHIFDPDTGMPSDAGLTSVTVVGADATTTDALSTAIFVMGAERGLELVASLSGYEAVISTGRQELYVTSGVANRFELRAEEYGLATP